MGRRCRDISCLYTAQDGSCLMKETSRPFRCPARETASKEVKDNWMIECLREKSLYPKKTRELVDNCRIEGP